MKNLLLIFIAQIPVLFLTAQNFSISPDKNNIFYIGVDNPVSIAVENCPCSSIVLKTDNGSITGKNCKFIYRGDSVGTSKITVFKKYGSKLQRLGHNYFRVKNFGPPVFKIGPSYYRNGRRAKKNVISNQEYVRAELEGTDFDVTYNIVRFKVMVFYSDSCKTKEFFNLTGKLSQEIKDAFSVLKMNDIVTFTSILAVGPGFRGGLDPLVLTILE